jgi:hypothetical protein
MVLIATLSACSLADTTTKINVDYNYTIEDITNQLTLLNIIRTKEGMPPQYTSVARLTGSVTLKGTAAFNAAAKAGVPTNTNQLQTQDAPTGTTITNTLMRQLATGGNVYTPAIGGEVDTGPSFDVSILDSQSFYEGILSSVPVSTFKNFLLQGYDSRRLMLLLTQQIEFHLKQATQNVSQSKGDVVGTMKNGGDAFNRLLSCFTFNPADAKSKGKVITPFSRVRTPRNGSSFSLSDLAMLDGTKLDLSDPLTGASGNDKNINLVRPPSSKDALQLVLADGCQDPIQYVNGQALVLPKTPPPEIPYLGSGRIMIVGKDRKTGVAVDTDMTATLRSPEGVIKFIGECLQPSGNTDEFDCKAGGEVLFTVQKGRPTDAVITTRVLGETYSVVKGANFKQTMQSIGLVERLIDLQKSATTNPVTIPVQVVP